MDQLTGITDLSAFDAAIRTTSHEHTSHPRLSTIHARAIARRATPILITAGAAILVVLLAREMVEQARQTAAELHSEGRRWLVQLEDPATWGLPVP